MCLCDVQKIIHCWCVGQEFFGAWEDDLSDLPGATQRGGNDFCLTLSTKKDRTQITVCMSRQSGLLVEIIV